MAIFRVRIDSLRVLEAGEDGLDGDAEWRLDFSAEGNRLHRFSDNSVRDLDTASINRSFLVDAPDNVLTLSTSGFEDDPIGDDSLPRDEVDIVYRPDLDPSLSVGLQTEARGGGFAYEVNWFVSVPAAVRFPFLGDLISRLAGVFGLAEDLDLLALQDLLAADDLLAEDLDLLAPDDLLLAEDSVLPAADSAVGNDDLLIA